MSFTTWKTHIEEGDLVIVHIARNNMVALNTKRGEQLTNKYGAFKHDEMIGKEYGTKLYSSNKKGFIYLLHPTPELWTLVLPHRTQILYIADISFITAYLQLKPGMRVIESGTGSGSFSHSIARTIAPTGKVYSFEYHETRASIARNEFQDHGLGDLIELKHRDVCKDGFGLQNQVNAVFLDLPEPWEAVASAKEAFIQNQTGKICSFSPCMEQVSRTVMALNANGFVDITMYECLMRNHDVSTIKKIEFDEAITEAKERSKEVAPKKRKAHQVTQDDLSSILVSATPSEVRGHTSYLTFAVFEPQAEEHIHSTT